MMEDGHGEWMNRQEEKTKDQPSSLLTKTSYSLVVGHSVCFSDLNYMQMSFFYCFYCLFIHPQVFMLCYLYHGEIGPSSLNKSAKSLLLYQSHRAISAGFLFFYFLITRGKTLDICKWFSGEMWNIAISYGCIRQIDKLHMHYWGSRVP